MPYLQTGEVGSRYLLPDLLNARGMHGMAVEVGTHRGEFAKRFLDRWTSGHLHCVDPWEKADKTYAPQVEFLADSSGDRRADRLAAIARIDQRHRSRYTMHVCESEQAADRFQDGTVDMVYVDGDHTFAGVMRDLLAWWPKLKSGGFLAGHDYLCPCSEDKAYDWGRYVQRAVSIFASSNGDPTVYLLTEKVGEPWSYYMVKGE